MKMQARFPFLLLLLPLVSSLPDPLQMCSSLFESTADLEERINVTLLFLRAPDEYKALADKCDEALKCAEAVDSPQNAAVLEQYRACRFYVFYNRDFAGCAHKLIAKKDEEKECLNTVFNEIYEPNVEDCPQWKGLQTCIKNQIKTVCDDTSGELQKQYVKEELNLRPTICVEEEEKIKKR